MYFVVYNSVTIVRSGFEGLKVDIDVLAPLWSPKDSVLTPQQLRTLDDVDDGKNDDEIKGENERLLSVTGR